MVKVCIRFIAPTLSEQSFVMCHDFSANTNVGHWIRWANSAARGIFAGIQSGDVFKKQLGQESDYTLEIVVVRPI
jgi:hypothetical protein